MKRHKKYGSKVQNSNNYIKFFSGLCLWPPHWTRWGFVLFPPVLNTFRGLCPFFCEIMRMDMMKYAYPTCALYICKMSDAHWLCTIVVRQTSSST